MTDRSAVVLSRLPTRLAESIRASVALNGGQLREIRLYRGQRPLYVVGERLLRGSVPCTDTEFDGFLLDACGHALYAHEETMRMGYIHTSYGVRIGIGGRAVMDNGRIARITDVASLCIRIPGRFPGAADSLLGTILCDGGQRSMLILSPPGVGKTTMLRELAVRLSSLDPPLRCVIVDTRQEIASGVDIPGIDVLSGYPRGMGMEIAVRTLAPQILLCDEIADEGDAQAIVSASSSGVAVIATAHGASLLDLRRNRAIGQLLTMGVFSTIAILSRREGHVHVELHAMEPPE